MEDLQKAVEYAGEAQKLGLDDLANNLLDFAGKGLKIIAARETNNDITEKERYELAQYAQQLGLDELAQDILDSKQINSECTYIVHAELALTDAGGNIHTIVDAYTYNTDIHKNWKGLMTSVITIEGISETLGETLSFDLPPDGSYVVVLPECELEAKMVGADTIIFTEVHVDIDGTRTSFDFPPAKIMRGSQK